MSQELFIPIKFNTIVEITPSEISNNIEEIIYKKIKKNLENRCSKHGYIKNDSISIVKRSIGQIRKIHFNGNIVYNLLCIAEICNPAQGSIIKCRIKAKNSLGLLADGYYNNIPILEITIPKISANIRSEVDIDKVNICDEVNIEVCGKKFNLFDKYISIIGRIIKDKNEVIKNVINIDDIYDEEKDEENDDIDKIDINIDEEEDEEDDEEDNEDKKEDDEEEDEDDDEEDEDLDNLEDDDLEEPDEYVEEDGREDD